jgi:hypothetical protein
VKIIESAGAGWLLWRKGLPAPIAKLTTLGELWKVLHPGTTEEVVQYMLDNPSLVALEECFLTPAGMYCPSAQHAVNLGVFLGIAPKHRSGLLGDKFGPDGRPRKARIAARRSSTGAGFKSVQTPQAPQLSTQAHNASGGLE